MFKLVINNFFGLKFQVTRPFLILFCLNGLVSCASLKPAKVELTFLDPQTMKPVSEMQVRMEKNTYSRDSLWYVGDSETRHERTDENGKVIFENLQKTSWKITAYHQGIELDYGISFSGRYGGIYVRQDDLLSYTDHKICLYNAVNKRPKLLISIVLLHWKDYYEAPPITYFSDCGGGGSEK